MNIKKKSIEELNALCEKIREKIIQVVSVNGGHLSSNLGSVEAIVAMHYVFNCEENPFIFDVSHQAYPHKLLTDRWDNFNSLRSFGGLSGYTKPDESKFDYFISGHSSTSISLATGFAKANALKKQNKIPIAFIGDGAMSGGMVYEALNELGDRKYPVVIILNDNEMSISKPIGAISKYLSQIMAGRSYQSLKECVEQGLSYLPESAAYMIKRFENSIKMITPGMIFEELGIEYVGPIDGHNIKALINAYKIGLDFHKPVIIHIQTIKGKGYEKAEGKTAKWHGVGPFDIKSGITQSSNKKSATEIFSEELLNLANSHENVVGLTAAMPTGTGLDKLISKYPDRFWDVAIAEQHAVTSMAAMAKEGFKPYVAIYSTFLQRAYDQIIHDCAILNLDVTFAIDRAGIVGEDGETHQGAFDISYLNAIPNITILAPRSAKSMQKVMQYTYKHKGVCAFRYPRGAFSFDELECRDIVFGKGEILQDGENVAFLSFGDELGKAFEVANMLDFTPLIADLIFIKPFDKEMLLQIAKKCKKWYIFSASAKIGGVASVLALFLQEENIYDVSIKSFEFNDTFIAHGDKKSVEKSLNLDPESIYYYIKNRS